MPYVSDVDSKKNNSLQQLNFSAYHPTVIHRKQEKIKESGIAAVYGIEVFQGKRFIKWSIAWYNKVREHQDDKRQKKKESKKEGGGKENHSRATQSLLRETSSIELSVVQNRRSVALRPLQLF